MWNEVAWILPKDYKALIFSWFQSLFSRLAIAFTSLGWNGYFISKIELFNKNQNVNTTTRKVALTTLHERMLIYPSTYLNKEIYMQTIMDCVKTKKNEGEGSVPWWGGEEEGEEKEERRRRGGSEVGTEAGVKKSNDPTERWG